MRVVSSWVDRRSSAGLEEARSIAGGLEARQGRMKKGCSPSHAMFGSEMGRCLVYNLRLSSEVGRTGRQVASGGRSDTAVLLAGSRRGCMWAVACRKKIEAVKAEDDDQAKGNWANLIAAWERD